MAKIKQYIDCNYSSRKQKPYVFVVHYTGSNNVDGTLSWFANPEARVSSHEVIDKNGDRYLTVPPEKKAWHAGKSIYYDANHPKGIGNVNDFSFGYELVGVYGSDFTEAQYDALAEAIAERIYDRSFDIALVTDLWGSIVGHEHIAPRRKIDPGPTFTWIKLYRTIHKTIIHNYQDAILPSMVHRPPIIEYMRDNYASTRKERVG